jgi:DNA/RNA endonuclease G (NUC1)
MCWVFSGFRCRCRHLIYPEFCAPLLSGGGNVLHYYHFSIVMHRQRRLAMFTASNIDESRSKRAPEG